MRAYNWQDGFKIVCILLWLHPLHLFGQSYPLGLNPPKLGWRAIETEKVQVIYPEALEDQGQYVTNMIHLLWDSSFYSLGPRKQQVSILLQNQNTTSNGFVTIGPFRSEFYLTPPQYNFLGNIDWLTGLAIHEYRHVEQFVNAKKSITKIGSILFGQNGWGVTAGLALPRWFFEGDAVFYETALTNGGRGRMANFENEYKALLLTGKKLASYEKASATSLKSFIPNHYNLGYHMTTSMRREFGADTLNMVVDRAVSYRSVLFPFSRGLKKLTGYRTPTYYKKLMSQLTSEWSLEDSLMDYDNGTTLVLQKKKTYTNYTNPVQVNDSTIMAFKSGYQDIFKVVAINLKTGKERKVVEPGFVPRSNASLSTNGRFLLWAQTGFHPRWGLLDYSEIWSFDLVNRKLWRLTEKTRYFTPALHPSGSQIAAIESTRDQKESLVIINTGTKEVIAKHTFEAGVRGAFPSWGKDDQVYFIQQNATTNALAVYDLASGDVQKISNDWQGVLGYVQAKGNYLYFNANFSGTDNIYRFHLLEKTVEKVTSSRFGTVHPAVIADQIVSADYSNDGYTIKSFDLKPELHEVDTITNKVDFIDPVLAQTPTLETKNEIFKSDAFKQNKGLLNFHSWTPLFLPPNLELGLEADNLLTTFSTDITYGFNTNENTSTYNASLNYGRYFPVFKLDISRGNRNRYVPVLFQEEENLFLDIIGQQWLEDDVSLSVILPLNTTWKNYFSNITLSQSLHKKWVVYEQPEGATGPGVNENFAAYTADLTAYFLRRRALQQINSRLGVSTEFNYRTTIGTDINQSNYFQTASRFFLPGIGRNHSFNITLSHQADSYASVYKFRDDLFYTRGYGAIPHDKFTNTSLNYSLPLLYPDLALGPFLFIQRIKANFFYDRGLLSINRRNLSDFAQLGLVAIDLSNGFVDLSKHQISSIGTEITLNFRFLRSLDIDAGVRISYPLNADFAKDPVSFEVLLFSVDI